MNFNLLRRDEAEQHSYDVRRRAKVYLLVSLCCVVGALVALPVAFFWQYQGMVERQYVTDTLWPLEEEIRRHNRDEERAKALAAQLADTAKRPHWPAVFVHLAETKPESIIVTSVTGDEGKLAITGLCDTMDTARQWQQRLGRRDGIRAARVKGMQTDTGQAKQFQWEVEFGVAQTS